MKRELNCQNCGKVFTAKRNTAKFCSADCKNEYNNAHRREQQEQKEGTRVPAPVTLRDVLRELKDIRTLLHEQNERILTMDQLREELDISEATLNRLLSEGVLQVHSFGGKSGTGRGRKPFFFYSEVIKALKQPTN